MPVSDPATTDASKGKKKSRTESGVHGAAYRVSRLVWHPPRPPLTPVTQDFPGGTRWVGGFLSGEADVEELGSSLNNMSISASPRFPTPQSYPPPGPLPVPPSMAMPVPQQASSTSMSRTMEYALSDIHLYNPHESDIPAALRPSHEVPARPHSDSILVSPTSPSAPLPGGGSRRRPGPMTPQKSNPLRPPSSVPPKPSRLDVSGRDTPTKGRRRAVSSPSTPVSTSSRSTPDDGTSVQCSGKTQAGQRCKRRVGVQIPLGRKDPDLNKEIERYCHHHMGGILSGSGFNRNGEFIEYNDYIPGYLQKNTRAALRDHMERPVTKADAGGYIYAFEIRDPSNTTHIAIKVGRATSLNKRIDQWSKQCSSKEQILRGWWPGGVSDNTRLLKGIVDPGMKGKYCHRLERLIHLELADISQNAQYLNKEFPDVTIEDKEQKKPATPCVDCGMIHKEIFYFRRAKSGNFKGREWEEIVRPVLMKWGKFVDNYAE